MVVDDLLIRIHRSLRPVGADDVLHPVIQPLAQGLLLLGRVEELVPIGVKLPQAPSGREVRLGKVRYCLTRFPSLFLPRSMLT